MLLVFFCKLKGISIAKSVLVASEAYKKKCLRARGLNVFIFLILAFVQGKLTVPQGPVRPASNLVACDWYILYESIMGHNIVSCQLTIHDHIHSDGKFAERLHDILV